MISSGKQYVFVTVDFTRSVTCSRNGRTPHPGRATRSHIKRPLSDFSKRIRVHSPKRTRFAPDNPPYKLIRKALHAHPCRRRDHLPQAGDPARVHGDGNLRVRPSNWTSARSACTAPCTRWRPACAARCSGTKGRNLKPTEAAQTLAEVAREVLRTMAEGIRATREVAGYSADRIRIGSLYSLTSRRCRRGHGYEDAQDRTAGPTGARLERRPAAQAAQGAIDAALMACPTPPPKSNRAALRGRHFLRRAAARAMQRRKSTSAPAPTSASSASAKASSRTAASSKRFASPVSRRRWS